MRERVRFTSEIPDTWSDFFKLIRERAWIRLQLLVWSEEAGQFKPTDHWLEIQIQGIGPLTKSDFVVIHASVRGDHRFDFVSPYLQTFKFSPDGTAELPHLIRFVNERAVA